jgi:hypothetical protein
MLISFILQILICSLLFFRERKGKQKKATLKNIIYFLVFKFFEGFLGEAFFQESSPKRVPDKSKFASLCLHMSIKMELSTMTIYCIFALYFRLLSKNTKL